MRDTVFFQAGGTASENPAADTQTRDLCLERRQAINFFVQNLPLLSVDIDLTYLPLHERDLALDEIRNSLAKVADAIKSRMPGTRILLKRIHGTDVVRGLIVEREGITVKVEPNLVVRGSVYPPETKALSKRAQDLFELSLQARILSPHDLYAGKICAPLDRRHPRDLFDAHLLLKSEGLKPGIRRAFIAYLVSHPRPMIEILSPKKKDIRDIFEKEFKGMIAEDIPFEALETTRNDLVKILREELTPDEKRFIVSIKEGHSRWDLLALEGAEKMPAVRRKLLNISKMDPAKHQKAVRKLRDYLGV